MKETKIRHGWNVVYYEVNDIDAFLKNPEEAIRNKKYMDKVGNNPFYNDEEPSGRAYPHARYRFMFPLVCQQIRYGDKKSLPKCMQHILDKTSRFTVGDSNFYEKENPPFAIIHYPNSNNREGIFVINLEKI